MKSEDSVDVTPIIVRESVKSFLNHNNFEMSVALASYGFFAIIPLLFFISYLLGNFTTLAQHVAGGIENLILHAFPHFNRAMIREFYFSTNYRITWGFISLLMVFISLMSVSDSLRTSFMKIFNIRQDISFLKLQLNNVQSTVIILCLFVILVASETAFLAYRSLLLDRLPFLSTAVETAASLAVAMISMVTVYLLFSPVKMDLKDLFVVSLTTSALFVLTKELFSYFIAFNPDYGVAFGTMKIFFIMIIWIYYCFLVILFGAEIIANIKKRDAVLLKQLFLKTTDAPAIPAAFIHRFIKIYDQGDIVFYEGDEGDSMCFIMTGSVCIDKHGHALRTMKKGDYFGEMSMLLDVPRTATVRVLEKSTQLVVITKENFEIILKESPDVVLAILKEMALRLKMTNESI